VVLNSPNAVGVKELLNEKIEKMKTSEIMKRTIIFLFAQLSKTDKKQLIDAIFAGSKLTKADAERLLSPIPTKELVGIGLISGMTKAQLIDAIASSAKLTKADAG
jgi:hypothetical protein